MRILAALVLILSVLFFLGNTLAEYQDLPEKVASNFRDNGGFAHGWMDKAAFLRLMIGVGLGVPAVIVGIMYFIRFLPPKYLNVPNHEYWRKPENHRRACGYIFSYSLWFSSIYLLWQTYVLHLIAEANRLSPPQLDGGKMGMAVGLLLGATLIGVVMLIHRFYLEGKA